MVSHNSKRDQLKAMLHWLAGEGAGATVTREGRALSAWVRRQMYDPRVSTPLTALPKVLHIHTHALHPHTTCIYGTCSEGLVCFDCKHLSIGCGRPSQDRWDGMGQRSLDKLQIRESERSAGTKMNSVLCSRSIMCHRWLWVDGPNSQVRQREQECAPICWKKKTPETNCRRATWTVGWVTVWCHFEYLRSNQSLLFSVSVRIIRFLMKTFHLFL